MCMRRSACTRSSLRSARANCLSGSVISESRYVGEVGLDAGPRFYKSLDSQRGGVPNRVGALRRSRRKSPPTVHSVRTAGAVLDMIEAHLPELREAPESSGWFDWQPQRSSARDCARVLFLGQHRDDAK